MSTRSTTRNETFAIAINLVGVAAVCFALIAVAIAAATPLAEVNIAHYLLGGTGLGLYAMGRKAFCDATIVNDYHSTQPLLVSMSKYTER